MMLQKIALYNTNITIIMVVVFALVCFALVGFLIKAMTSSGKKETDTFTEPKE